VPAFQSAGLEIAGIAGSDPEKTRRTSQKLGVRAFQDWRALVGEAAIDLVSIVTPPSKHAVMALAALEAGKNVLAEKPTALDASEAQRMAEAAERHPGQLALIDHELRFLPAWREARRRMSQIAPLRYLEARYSSPGRADRTRPWNWWSDASQGGGVWGAVGSHLVDALRYFAGEVEAIQAFLHTFIAERPTDAGTRRVTSDDFAAVHASLESSAFATMTLSVVAGVDEPSTLTVHGERGALRLERENLWAASPGGDWVQQLEGEAPMLPGNSPGGAFGTGTLYLGRALRAALDDGDRDALAPAATFADGLEQQRILDAARRSHANDGRWENVERV